MSTFKHTIKTAYGYATPYVIAIIASLIAGLGVVYFQYIEDLAPCELCVLQRYGWAVAFVAGVVGYLHDRPYLSKSPKMTYLLVIIILAGLGHSFVTAIIHTGVQFDWWQWQSACTGALSADTTSLEALTKSILNAPVQRCDEIEWDLWGWITIPVLNAVLSGYNFIDICISTAINRTKNHTES